MTQPLDFGQDSLLQQMGTATTNKATSRLSRFAYIPFSMLQRLAGDALNENWGDNLYVLKKYIAVHLGWAIEQQAYTHTDTQLIVTAGSLQTRYGTPLYLVFEKNNSTNDSRPWALCFAGSQLRDYETPVAASIPEPPVVPAGAEIVMMHDHILGDNVDRVDFLRDTPPVAQMCAVSGAIQWSLNRRLQIPYWYYGRMQYLVPLYLKSRENITLAPDVIAPVEVTHNRLLVRTVLKPSMPYASARVATLRHDQLPAWMLDCWNAEPEPPTDEDDDSDNSADEQSAVESEETSVGESTATAEESETVLAAAEAN